ncbi:MAG: hypothetical protein JW788_05940 [Candidatus Omnitrophica bacterium]|nr:hypothetical protein [Candidatus Omnitrophota bacterium]
MLPWIYLFFNRSIEKNRVFLVAPFLLALTIYSGSIYAFIISSLALFIYGAVSSLEQKTLRQTFAAIKVIFIAAIFASPKVLPMAELLNQYKRTIILPPWAGIFSPAHLKAGIHEIKHFFFAGDKIYSLGVFINDHVDGYNFDLASILLLICSYFILWKRSKPLLAMNVIFLLLALGDNSPLNIWRIFHAIFSPFRGAQKFFGGLLFSFSLTLGLSAEWFQARFLKQEKAKKIFFFCILSLVFYGVFTNASMILVKESTKDYRLKAEKSEFSQGCTEYGKMFESVYNNTGVLNAFDNVGDQIEPRVISCEQREYKGEYFLKDENGSVERRLFSPNKLVFKVDLSSQDTLIINQNYFPGWHSTQGKVVNSDGLLGVQLQKGQTDLSLYYFPPSLAAGIILFVLSVGFILKRRLTE